MPAWRDMPSCGCSREAVSANAADATRARSATVPGRSSLTTLVRIIAGSWEVSAGKQAVKESPLADSFHATVETILVLMLIVFAVALLARWARLPTPSRCL
jgi:hypothetical protein